MHLSTIVVLPPSSSSNKNSQLSTSSSSKVEASTSRIFIESKQEPREPRIKMGFLFGASLALAGMMGLAVVVSQARIVAREPNGNGDYAAVDNGGGGYPDDATGDTHINYRSAKGVSSAGGLPAEFRKIPPAELKRASERMFVAFKKCTVSQLNLADLAGSWTLANFVLAVPRDKSIQVHFVHDKPHHLSGSLMVTGERRKQLNFTQHPSEMPGVLIHVSALPNGTIESLSPMFILAHKRHRYFVSLVGGERGMEVALYVRQHHKSHGKKQPKKPTEAELNIGMASVSCLFKESGQGDVLGDTPPEELFRPVL